MCAADGRILVCTATRQSSCQSAERGAAFICRPLYPFGSLLTHCTGVDFLNYCFCLLPFWLVTVGIRLKRYRPEAFAINGCATEFLLVIDSCLSLFPFLNFFLLLSSVTAWRGTCLAVLPVPRFVTRAAFFMSFSCSVRLPINLDWDPRGRKRAHILVSNPHGRAESARHSVSESSLSASPVVSGVQRKQAVSRTIAVNG